LSIISGLSAVIIGLTAAASWAAVNRRVVSRMTAPFASVGMSADRLALMRLVLRVVLVMGAAGLAGLTSHWLFDD
jgi:hypothetical protein